MTSEYGKINTSKIDITVNTQSLYESNTDISVFTKQNLNRLYPGYGRELGFNRIKITLSGAVTGLVGSLVTQASGCNGILAEEASSETIIYVIVTSAISFAGSATTITVNGDSSKNAQTITYEPLGYNDSIGVHSFCLDTTNTPSGHLSANTPFNIALSKTGTNDINIYLEVIKFYKIMGGQLGLMYT